MLLDRELSPQIGQNVSLAIYTTARSCAPSFIKIKIDFSMQLPCLLKRYLDRGAIMKTLMKIAEAQLVIKQIQFLKKLR